MRFLNLSVAVVFLTNLLCAQQTTIHFASDSHHLSSEATFALQSLCNELNNASVVEDIAIAGYTDADASEEYNYNLSKMRAETVMNFMLKANVPQRLFLAANGENLPLNANQTEEEKAQNRRVVIERNHKPDSFRLEDRDQRMQYFDIDPTVDTQLKCNLGTEVHIAKGTINAPHLDKLVRIGICEYYSAADFVFSQLNTTTVDGKLLETAGTVFIQAEQDGIACDLNEGKSIDILFSLKEKNDGMQLFDGKENNNQVLWELAQTEERAPEALLDGSINDIVPADTFAGGASGNRTKYFLFWRVPDWTRRSRLSSPQGNSTTSGAQLDTTNMNVEEVEELHENSKALSSLMSSRSLGWINCDRFYNYKTPKINQEVVFADSVQPSVQLVFTDIRSVMGYCAQKQGGAAFRNVPMGERIVVTAMYTSDTGEIMFAMMPAHVSKEPLRLEFEPKTEEEINSMLTSM